MSRIRDRIERKFAAAAGLLYRHNILTLLLLAVFVGGLLSQLPKLTLDTSTEGFLHEQDPALLAYNDFRDQFGNTEMVIVAVKGKDIFAPEFLQKLKKMHVELRDTVPYLDDINSLINARNTRGEGDQLIVEDLLEHWPETPEELAAVKERAVTNPLYKNLLISEEGDFTAIVLQMQAYSSQGEEVDDVLAGFTEESNSTEQKERIYLTDAENGEVVQAVTRIVDAYRSADFEIYVAGGPVVTDFLKKAMMKNMRKFMILAILTIGIFLFLMFRRASAVFLPLFVVILSLLSTLGLMAACGTPIKLPTQILPSFLLAVGVGDSVHILAIFFHRLRRNSWDKAEAVQYAVGHSGLAVFMTSLTTAGGLLSFSTADVAPIADLGIYAAAGVMLALLYTLILLPSLLALIPLKEKKKKETHKENGSSRLDGILASIGHVATGNPKTILAITALIFIVSIIGITRIKFSHDIVRWYKKDSPIRVASETIDEEMRGSIALEIVLDTGKVNGLYDPDLLQRIDNSVKYVEQVKKGKIFAGKAWSITTILKEIHQALNENRAEFYKIPDNPQLIPQEFLLFENSGSDDLEDVTDSQFSKVRFTIKVPFQDAIAYTDFMQTINEHFTQTFPELKITTTGMTSILFQTMARVIRSMAKSYTIALIVITILMILLIGKLRTGILSMVPNLFPIMLTLGVMGWFQVPLDLFTMLVGSISIGLAVDDTIHFMHNFRRYFEQSGDAKLAVMETLHSTGRAMLITTCVLSVGFFIFMFANMNNLFNFGWLTGFTIIMALLADYFIAPALMVLVNRTKLASVNA